MVAASLLNLPLHKFWLITLTLFQGHWECKISNCVFWTFFSVLNLSKFWMQAGWKSSLCVCVCVCALGVLPYLLLCNFNIIYKCVYVEGGGVGHACRCMSECVCVCVCARVSCHYWTYSALSYKCDFILWNEMLLINVCVELLLRLS